MNRPEFEAAMAAKKRQDAECLKRLSVTLATGSASQIVGAIGAATEAGIGARAWRLVARRPRPKPTIRLAFAAIWIQQGDSLRADAADDLAFVTGIRKLLPKYRGGSMRLYRGETWHNRTRRTYGLSWTSNRDVAVSFARGFARDHVGGSCVICALVPAGAIVYAPGLYANSYREDEYVVDRRAMHAAKIEVVERFPQSTKKSTRGGSAH